MAERPKGWRPFTSEQKDQLRSQGFDEEAIASMEQHSVYTPNETALVAYEIGRALLVTAAREFGTGFTDKVRAELVDRCSRLDNEGVEGEVEADIVRGFLDAPLWSELHPE